MQSKTHRSKLKNLVDEKVVYTEKDTISFSQTIKNAEHKLIIKRKSITQKEREKDKKERDDGNERNERNISKGIERKREKQERKR